MEARASNTTAVLGFKPEAAHRARVEVRVKPILYAHDLNLRQALRDIQEEPSGAGSRVFKALYSCWCHSAGG